MLDATHQPPPAGQAASTALPAPAPATLEEYPNQSSSKDRAWGWAYLACWFAVVALACAAYTISGDDVDKDLGNLDVRVGNAKGWHNTPLWPLAAWPLAAVVFTALWFVVMATFAGAIIKTCLVLNIALLCAGAAWCAFAGSVPGLIVFALLALFSALYAWWVWRKVAFSEACLVSAIDLFRLNAWPVVAHFASGMFSMCMLACCGAAALTVVHYAQSGARGVLLVLVLLVFFWTAQIHGNAAWVTSVAVAGQFLCNAAVPWPTWAAWKRAYSSLFGTICFGAFIEAAIRTLRFLVNYVRSHQNEYNAANQCLLCCLDCLLRILGDVLQYVNTFAYVHVGLYGKDYRAAMRDTFELFRARGFDALINDDLTSLPMVAGVYVFILVAFGGMFALAGRTIAFAPPSIVGLVLGLIILATALTVLTAYAKTIFVVWAQDTAAMAHRNSVICQRLSVAAREMPYTLVVPPT